LREPDQNAADLVLLTELGREAGKIALRYFGEAPQVWMKEGDSPASEADFAVDSSLKEKLLQSRPDYGWLSEETDDNDERLSAKRVFVVDPIDGTRGFIEGKKQWCVSIAVVENNRPVVGVLECPVLGETVTAAAGNGACLNNARIAVPKKSASTIVMTGPRAFTTDVGKGLPEDTESTPFVPSLAYRIGLVAMGRVDVALARASARDWDLAAADLIAHEAGARLSDLQGNGLTYNCRSARHGTLVASAAKRHDEMLDLARQAMNKPDQ